MVSLFIHPVLSTVRLQSKGFTGKCGIFTRQPYTRSPGRFVHFAINNETGNGDKLRGILAVCNEKPGFMRKYIVLTSLLGLLSAFQATAQVQTKVRGSVKGTVAGTGGRPPPRDANASVTPVYET